MMKKLIIPVPTYNVKVQVFFLKDDKKILKKHNKLNKKINYNQENNFNAKAITYPRYTDKKGCNIVSILFDDKVINEGIIAHEAFHAATFILCPIDIKLSWESDEAFAYLIGYIVNEITKHKQG